MLAKAQAYRVTVHGWHCKILINTSGEKPWDFSLEENCPYFAPAATWDRTRDLPLSVEFRVVPTLVPVWPHRRLYQ